MASDSSYSARSDKFHALAGPVFLLLGVVIAYLRYHSYPLAAPESLLALTIAAAAGLAYGALLALLGPSNGRALLVAALVGFFVSVQFGLFDWLFVSAAKIIGPTAWLRIAIMFIVSFALLLAALAARQHLATICSYGFLAFLASVLLVPRPSITFGLTNSGDSSTAVSDQPVLIHIILDGHIGIEGIPRDLPGGDRVRQATANFYTERGFAVHSRAYSPYLLTFNAIGNSVNGAMPSTDLKYATASRKPGFTYRLTANEVIESMLASGRRVHVLQSDHIDFCDHEAVLAASCTTYPSSSFHGLSSADIGALAKSLLILESFFARTRAVAIVKRFQQIAGGAFGSRFADWRYTRPGFYSISAPEVLETLGDRIEANGRGHAYFAHVLLPHAPLARDAQCQLREDTDEWLPRKQQHNHLMVVGTAEYRSRAYARYFEQIDCVTGLVGDLLDKLERTGLLDDATIVIHGDHGSRITVRDPIADNADAASERDYIDTFSTLFAVRGPGIEAGIEPSAAPLPALVAASMLSRQIDFEARQVFLRPWYQRRDTPLVPKQLPAF